MDLTEAEDTKRWQEYTKSEVIQLCLTLQPHAYQAPPSMEFSRQEYLSGLPFPSPGDLPDEGWNLGLLHCRQTLCHPNHQGSPEYKELYKKDLHDPDKHDGVIPHLQPDDMECKVKWALGSITDKASRGDGIQFRLLTHMLSRTFGGRSDILQE